MSNPGRNPTYKWLTYEPQSADPSSPNEGDVFYSDGTPRTEGLWVYINAAWAQISTSVASSVFTKITFTPQSSDPGSPSTGMVFYSDGTARAEGLWVYTGSDWTQLSGVRYEEYSIRTPVTVRVASTANVTLASQVENGDTIDGVVLATGDLVLLKNQSAASENGVYVVATSGAPTRDTSADTYQELNDNFCVFVKAGTTNVRTMWFQTATLTSLSDAQTWSSTPATYTVTVPDGVYSANVDICGGGGGGGGAGTLGGGTRTAGAGGGAGAQLVSRRLKVAPGDTFTVAIGKPGYGGTAGTNTTNASNGGDGGNTTVTGTDVYLYAPGASGGTKGSGTTPGAGGSTYANNNTLLGLLDVSAGGTGITDGLTDGGDGEATAFVFTPAQGGTATGISNRGGAGGAGGSGPYNLGGDGGDSTASAQANHGSNAPTDSYGAGGGGASGNLSGSSTQGGYGGHGNSGYARFTWG